MEGCKSRNELKLARKQIGKEFIARWDLVEEDRPGEGRDRMPLVPP